MTYRVKCRLPNTWFYITVKKVEKHSPEMLDMHEIVLICVQLLLSFTKTYITAFSNYCSVFNHQMTGPLITLILPCSRLPSVRKDIYCIVFCPLLTKEEQESFYCKSDTKLILYCNLRRSKALPSSPVLSLGKLKLTFLQKRLP